jgi:hypothetical protein
MTHSNKMLTYLIGAAVVAAVLIALGAPLASVTPFAIVLLCPLMMIVMMRSMGGMDGAHGREDHRGHGCEHDPTRQAESPTGHRH